MSDSSRASAPAIPIFEAVLTQEQVYSLEAEYEASWGVKRRLMLVTLSRSSQELIDGFAELLKVDNGDHYFELIDHLTDYVTHLKSGLALAEAAVARTLLVGNHLAN